MKEYKSKSRYYVDTLLKQPGIDESMSLKQLRQILDDDEKARIVDQKLESPFYNQASITFIRLMLDCIDTLLSCSPRSIKIFLKLAQHANQSNMICISKKDLKDFIGLSVPTINVAMKELEEKGLIIIEERNIANAEANLYIINPKVCASAKMTSQNLMISEFWKRAGNRVKETFSNINKVARQTFADTFEAGERKLDGSFYSYMDIAKRGKRKNQEKEATTRTKKKVTADQTSDDQLTPEASVVNSLTQTNYNKPELEIQEDLLFDEMPGQMAFFETDKNQ